MARIIIDEKTVQSIKAANGSFELCDKNGTVIAVGALDGSEYPIVIDEPPLPTDDEIKAMLAGPRYTLEEVLEGLEG
jgi:hypothetical protein